jgi:hypothetical protein
LYGEAEATDDDDEDAASASAPQTQRYSTVGEELSKMMPAAVAVFYRSNRLMIVSILQLMLMPDTDELSMLCSAESDLDLDR